MDIIVGLAILFAILFVLVNGGFMKDPLEKDDNDWEL
jgi:hypothetical protein